MIGNVPEKKYFVLFRKADLSDLPWYWIVLFKLFFKGKHEPFSHVDLFFEDQHGNVIFIALASWQIGIVETSLTLENALKELKKESTACLEFTSMTLSDTFNPRGVLSCVSVVKSILGLRGFGIRPLTLFKQLKQKGAKILWQPL